MEAHYIPATEIASDNELSGLANVVMLGAMLRVTKIFDYDFVEAELVSSVPKSKPQLAELNKKALRLGYDYKE